MVASPLEKPGEYAFVYQMGMFYGENQSHAQGAR
jgi:hypothetical protein